MASADDFVLRVTDLHKSFGTQPLLQGLSLSLRERERLAVLGPGGCGKSTLLKIIMGIVDSDRGNVTVLGQDLESLDKKQRGELLRDLAMAFQLGALFDFMTVRENILFAMENMRDLPRAEMEERVKSLLDRVNLPNVGRRFPSELSGGMRRRVGIVRALCTEPRVALLDEPTAGLDPVTTTVVIDMIHAIAKQTGSSLLCVTSSVEVAFTFSERVAIMKDGRIVGEGTWEDLHKSPDPWVSRFLDVREFTPPHMATPSHDEV